MSLFRKKDSKKIKPTFMKTRTRKRKIGGRFGIPDIDNINSIITTHQARIRCLVDEITNFELSPLQRFMNACVLKLSISQQTINIELVYSGFVDEEKPKYIYYVTSIEGWQKENPMITADKLEETSDVYTVFDKPPLEYFIQLMFQSYIKYFTTISKNNQNQYINPVTKQLLSDDTVQQEEIRLNFVYERVYNYLYNYLGIADGKLTNKDEDIYFILGQIGGVKYRYNKYRQMSKILEENSDEYKDVNENEQEDISAKTQNNEIQNYIHMKENQIEEIIKVIKEKARKMIKEGKKYANVELKGKYKIKIFEPTKIENRIFNVDQLREYNFYLIRHGQADHNLRVTGFQKFKGQLFGSKDTRLTKHETGGKNQAYELGKYMSEKELIPEDISYLFSSDLLRTRETMDNFLNGLYCGSNKEDICNKKKELPFVVLPCAHELTYTPGAKCDGKQGVSAKENIMNCNPNNIECQKVGENDVDWSYYKSFYRGTRSKPCRFCSRRYCRSTNMIQEAIDYITTQFSTPKTQINITAPTQVKQIVAVEKDEDNDIDNLTPENAEDILLPLKNKKEPEPQGQQETQKKPWWKIWGGNKHTKKRMLYRNKVIYSKKTKKCKK